MVFWYNKRQNEGTNLMSDESVIYLYDRISKAIKYCQSDFGINGAEVIGTMHCVLYDVMTTMVKKAQENREKEDAKEDTSPEV